MAYIELPGILVRVVLYLLGIAVLLSLTLITITGWMELIRLEGYNPASSVVIGVTSGLTLFIWAIILMGINEKYGLIGVKS